MAGRKPVKAENVGDLDRKAYRVDDATVPKSVYRAVCDEIAHDKLDDIIAGLGGTPGTPVFFDDARVSTPNVAQDLIDITVPASTTRKLQKVVVICRSSGKYIVTVDGVTIGSGRTGAASTNSVFEWPSGRSAAQNTNIKITFTQNSGPAQDIECYLMALDT